MTESNNRKEDKEKSGAERGADETGEPWTSGAKAQGIQLPE